MKNTEQTYIRFYVEQSDRIYINFAPQITIITKGE